ncbi:hypothetical protein FA13DRAFT_1800625 [Coprinellus micaceus]|uniref:F-box domain-containing protein n=1 Tax=Coprinellus micaceus TaxID=71717 RepID=A0A4Y7SGT6_COPMI|nr:hypothetical protein FA13DRAFT_1800625 [Coprinellus micaceus]
MPHPGLPDFPLEIWLHIFSFACADSGVTSRSLSLTSRYLRAVSREYRYHTVMIEGWRQLLAFQTQFTGSTAEDKGISAEDRDAAAGQGETRRLVHLYVHIPELYTDAYPPESWFEDEDSDVDSTYDPSDDEWEDVEDGDDGGEECEAQGEIEAEALGVHRIDLAPHDLERQANGESNTSHDNPSPSPPSSSTHSPTDEAASPPPSSSSSLDPDEVEEFALDSPTLSPSEIEDFHAEGPDITTPSELQTPPIHGQDFEMLKATPLPLAQLEYPVLSSLRRILEASAHSLQTFTLCFSPSASFYPEALIPPLPRLRTLAILKSTIPQEDVAPVRYKYHLQRVNPAPKLFPALEELKVGCNVPRKHSLNAWDDDAFDGLLGQRVRSVSAPCRLIKYLHPFPRSVTSINAWGPARKGETWGRLEPDQILDNLCSHSNKRYKEDADYIRETGMSTPEEFREDWMERVQTWV